MANLTENFNYLQPTSFKLVLDRRNYPNLEFFCQSITHPGMILNPVELGIPRLSGIPIAGESLTFNELSTNIILDENMQGYGEMYNWMLRLVNNNLGSGSGKGSIASDTGVPDYADITLSILSSHNNQTKQVRYIDCIPTSLGDIQFESTADGQTFITFAAGFRFNYFKLV
jgi:hypothetical protein